MHFLKPIHYGIFFLFSLMLQAQELPLKNTFSFAISHTDGGLKDLVFAPVAAYNYQGMQYQLHFYRTTKKEHFYKLSFSSISTRLISDKIPALNADYTSSRLDFCFLWKTYTKNKFKIHSGIHSQSISATYSRYIKVQQKLGIGTKTTYALSAKTMLSTALTIPLVFLEFGDLHSRSYGLSHYQGLLWDIKCQYSLSRRWDVYATYAFSYDRIQIPNAYREVQHQYYAGINYNF